MSILSRLILREMRARRAQFVAVSITIVLGVGLFGASYDAFQNLTSSYRGLYDRLSFADIVATAGSPDAVAAAVQADPEVAAVTTRHVADIPLAIGSHHLLGRIVGLPPNGEPAVDRILVLRGSNLDPAVPDGVVVEQHLADQFHLEPGVALSVFTRSAWREVKVLGIVASPEYLWPARSRQEIIVSPDSFGVVFAPEAFVTTLPSDSVHGETLVRLEPAAAPGTLDRLRDVALRAGANDVQTQADQPSNAGLLEDVNGFAELSLMFPMLFLGAAALATYVLLGRLVAAQRGQIGMLRASGFPRRRILWYFLAIGLLVGLAGSVPGVILGAVSAEAISRIYTGVISVPITVVELRPTTWLIGGAAGLLAGALAALAPSRRAAALSPAAAMGAPLASDRGGRSLVERVVPAVRRLPLRWLLAIRGLGRNRLRSLSTIVGVALATSLILVSWGMIDTVQILLDRQFLLVQRQDAELYLAAPLPASQAATAYRPEGVATAEPALELAVTIGSPSARYSTTIVGLLPGTVMHEFVATNGARLALPGEGVLLGRALHDRLGVTAGDVVTVTVTDGSSAGSQDVRIAGFVDEPLGTYAYASLAQVARMAGDTTADPVVRTVMVRFDPGADHDLVQARLMALPSVAADVDSRALYRIAQQLMALFYAFVGVMLVFGGVMAFALIFNTLSANVAERSTELAGLRALGMSRRTIGRLVTTENMLLTLIGLVPGIAGGYVLAAEFMGSFSSDMFDFNLAIRPTTFIVTALAIVAVAALSQVPAIRSIGRIDLARIVRERSL